MSTRSRVAGREVMAWWGIARAIVGTTLDMVGSWLCYASCGHVVGIFVDSGLHRLEKLVEVHEVTLCPHVAHWWK